MNDPAVALSDLGLKYPFAPKSREFFESIPMEERLTSAEVLKQAEARLMGCLGRGKYEPHPTEQIEFSSFFAAALVASQDSYLISKFAKSEGEMAKRFFTQEYPRTKAAIVGECFGVHIDVLEEAGRASVYSIAFQDYLSLITRLGLAKQPEWKLVRQPLQDGRVYMSDNLVNDFFGDCAQQAVASGSKNLRRALFPKQLIEVRSAVMKYVPPQRSQQRKGYSYVEELLKYPAIVDGRKRLAWLVLSGWATNVKQLSDEEAIDLIQNYISTGGATSEMKRLVAYNVRRARRLGLMPPTFSKLKAEHPDLYALLPKEVVRIDAEQDESRNRKRSSQ